MYKWLIDLSNNRSLLSSIVSHSPITTATQIKYLLWYLVLNATILPIIVCTLHEVRGALMAKTCPFVWASSAAALAIC